MNTKYELTRLEGIISKDMSTFIKMNCRLDQDLFVDFKSALKEEIERVKTNFSKAIFSFRKRRSLKQYVRFHQREIIRLSGYLLNYVPPKRIHMVSKSLDNALLCQQLYWSLEELLSFVEKHFTKYYDQDAWIPESYRLITVNDIQRNTKTLQTELLHRGVDKELVLLALHPLREFIESPPNEVTYRKVTYLRELEKGLYQLIPALNDPPNSALSVQWLLFYLNLNSLKYFNYATEKISLYANGIENLSDRIERLAFVQKLIHQYQTKPSIGYDPKQRTLKEQLSDWLTQEINYQEKRSKSVSIEPDNAETESPFKIKIDLSVPQLAYLLRVFIETHIIQNKNIVSLIRILTRVFQTKRTDTISYDSTHNKYYNPESSTKEAVKKLLLKMVAFIEKDMT